MQRGGVSQDVEIERETLYVMDDCYRSGYMMAFRSPWQGFARSACRLRRP